MMLLLPLAAVYVHPSRLLILDLAAMYIHPDAAEPGNSPVFKKLLLLQKLLLQMLLLL